jgi:hypothetical protein
MTALPDDEVLRLLGACPPHRSLDAFLAQVAGWRRRAGAVPDPVESAVKALSEPVHSVAFARACAGIVRGLHEMEAAAVAGIEQALRARFPAPEEPRRAMLDRVAAVAELVRLREAGRLSRSASLRVAYLFDPARAPDPPADVAKFFGDPPGGPVGLRAADALLRAEAPTAWRLAEREYRRLIDRLDPAAE